MLRGRSDGVVVSSTEERLTQLAAVITEAHAATMAAAESMVVHAITVGEALLEAKTLVPAGEWTEWVEKTIPDGKRKSMAGHYMRLATYKEHVDPALSITANVLLLRGMEPRSMATAKFPEHIKDEARRRVAAGESCKSIAADLGTTITSVRKWSDPEYREVDGDRGNRQARERRAAIERVPPPALTDEERAYRYGEPGRAAIGRAVRVLATRQGKVGTTEALLDLSAIALAWAARLGARHDEQAAA